MKKKLFVSWAKNPDIVGGCETIFGDLTKEIGGEFLSYPFGNSPPSDPNIPAFEFIEEYKAWYFDSVIDKSKADIVVANCGTVNVWKKHGNIKIVNVYNDAYIKAQIAMIKAGYSACYNPRGILKLSEMQIKSSSGAVNVAISNITCEAMKDLGIRCDRIIEHGVDSNLFKPMDKEEMKAKHDLHGKKIGIFVGIPQPVKNWLCFQDIMRKCKDISWIVVLKNMWLYKPRIYMNNADVFIKVPRNIMPELYSAADFVLVTSCFESFGLTSVEGGLCNVPVITSKTGWVEDTGVTDYGIVVDSTDASEYIKAIKNIGEYSFSPRKYMKKRFDYNKWVDKWKRFLDGL